MFRISGVAVSLSISGAAAALLCSMTLLGPNAAWAQKITKLNCNKCVGTGDIAKKAITKSRIKKKAVKENRLSTDLQEHFNGRESFYITLDGDGSTETIATNGPLSYFARCRLNQDNGVGGFEDRIEIVATSSVAGWFEDDESDSSAGNPPLNAGQEVIANNPSSDGGTVTPSGSAYYEDLEESSIVAPDGSYLAIKGDASGFGLNIFGHDCLVVGNVHRATGTP